VGVWQTEPRQEEISTVRVTTFRRRLDEAFRRGHIGDTVMVTDASSRRRTQRQGKASG
jgi:hypothetical protein